MAQRRHKPIPEDIGDWLYIDESSPSGLRWKKTTYRRGKPGAPAGGKSNVRGYCQVRIRGELFLGHRIIYFLKFGEQPPAELDHRRGVADDFNTRACTHAQNGLNRDKQSNNTSGFKGVSFHKGKWRARFRRKFLGHFSTKEKAAHAYNEAAYAFDPEFARLNEITS